MQIIVEKGGRVTATPETPSELRTLLSGARMRKFSSSGAKIVGGQVECNICHKAFGSEMGLKVHKAHMHREANVSQ